MQGEPFELPPVVPEAMPNEFFSQVVAFLLEKLHSMAVVVLYFFFSVSLVESGGNGLIIVQFQFGLDGCFGIGLSGAAPRPAIRNSGVD